MPARPSRWSARAAAASRPPATRRSASSRPTAGQVEFLGADLTRLDRAALRHAQRDMQIIFQDPYSSLDPKMTVGESIGEPLLVRGVLRGDGAGAPRRGAARAGRPAAAARQRYPHEFSGGQRQRIVIARALALPPKLIVCDEPVSALDVSIRSQILNLLMRLQRELGVTYLFISHDLSVVRHISDRVAVMYLGHIVEEAPTERAVRRADASLHAGAAERDPAARPGGAARARRRSSCRATCRARPRRRRAARSAPAARSPAISVLRKGRASGPLPATITRPVTRWRPPRRYLFELYAWANIEAQRPLVLENRSTNLLTPTSLQYAYICNHITKA